METSAGPEEDLPSPKIGVALHGDFDEGKILGSMEEETEGEVGLEQHRGYSVYSGDSDQSDGFAFSVLDADTLLIGTSDGVKAMIDVAEGVVAPLSGEVIHALDALGDRHMGMILAQRLPKPFRRRQRAPETVWRCWECWTPRHCHPR